MHMRGDTLRGYAGIREEGGTSIAGRGMRKAQSRDAL